jgi:hypothetical protein
LPGDASVRFVHPLLLQDLTHLSATHHGSLRSLQGDGNAIPEPLSRTGGTIFFSYGTGNQYGHNPNNVSSIYGGKGWTVVMQTPAAQSDNNQLTFHF